MAMRIFTKWLFATLIMGLSSHVAAADSYRKVKPAKFETSAPKKGYHFSETFAFSPNRNVADDYHLQLVTYRSEDRSLYAIEGLLDMSGKKPRWAVEPKFERIYPATETFSLAKPSLSSNFCIKKHAEKNCVDSGFKYAASFRRTGVGKQMEDAIINSAGQGPAPDWSAPVMFYERTGRGLARVIFLSPEGEPLGIIENVALRGEDTYGTFGKRFVQAVKYGDAAIIRVENDEGKVRDVAVTYSNGELFQTEMPSFSIYLQSYRFFASQGPWPRDEFYEEHYRYMFTADQSEQLYFPLYPEGAGFKTAPEDLIGIRPLGYVSNDWTSNEKSPEFFRSIPADDADFLSCCRPMGWLAKWATEDGMRWAFVRKDAYFPTYEEILESRAAAKYVDYFPLWDTAHPDPRESSKDGLYFRYAFDQGTDQLEIFRPGYKSAEEHKRRETVLIESIPRSGLQSYIVRKIAENNQAQAEATRRYQEFQASQAAAEVARKQAYAAWEARKRQRRVEADARAEARKQRAAEMRAFEEEQARQAAEYRAQANATPHPDAFWNAWQTDGVNDAGSSSRRSVAPIDYWKSYDSSNRTGQYTTSSGAATGCKIGDPNC